MNSPEQNDSGYLEGKQVQFRYEPGRATITDACIAVKQGSMSALIGANGCGKSTLIRLLGGLQMASGGGVYLGGRLLAKWDRRQLARKLAYVPQSISRAFPFTSLEVVLTGRTPYASPFRLENTQDLRIARQALHTVGVAHLESRRITELSGGERQLVSVARALAQEPECILLDEPSSSLDLKHRAGLIRTLLDLRRQNGLTVLMVTHDLNLLDPAFDSVFAMRCGTIAASGTPEEVLRDEVLRDIYDDPYVRARKVDGQICVRSEVHA